MTLGPDNFNLTISLDSIFCFQGDDIDDVFDEESEPYLWVFMIKLDAEGLRQQGNQLVGVPVFFLSPGSHGKGTFVSWFHCEADRPDVTAIRREYRGLTSLLISALTPGDPQV